MSRRAQLAVVALLLLLFFDLAMGALRWSMGFRAPLVPPIAAVVVVSLVVLRLTGRFGFVTHVISGALVAIFASLTVFAGTTASAPFLGFAMVSLAATFLGGWRAGFGWTLLSLVTMGALEFAPLEGVTPPVAPGAAMPAPLSAVLVVVTYGVAWGYEWSRARDREILSRQALRTSGLLSALPEVVLEVDPAGTCVALHGLGATRPPFLGARRRPLAPLFPDDERSLRDALARVREEEATTLELELDREGRTWNLRVSPLRDDATLVVARDVTSARQLETQLLEAEMRSSLERADRMSSIGILAAGMAHEINNPLAYLAANLAFLDSGPLDRGEQAEALADACDAADRIRRIVDDLRVYARREDELDGDEAVPLASVASAALKLARNQLQHRAQIVVEHDAEAVARGSEARLVQVVLNLLVNAAQAIPPGAASAHRVTLRTWVEGGRARIAVEDTGEGIPAAVLDQVTQPFFTTKPVGVGTGLGLSVCDGIVRQLGGSLRLDSEVGVGTRAEIDLPVAQPTDRVALSRRPVPRTTDVRAGRILVVDDEPLVRRALRRLLRPQEVVEVGSGREALERLEHDRRFDLVLCDVMMPDVTGIEVHEQLAATAPELAERFVFMTGGAIDGDTATLFGRLAPARRVIQKPFRPDVLADVVAEELGRPRPRPLHLHSGVMLREDPAAGQARAAG